MMSPSPCLTLICFIIYVGTNIDFFNVLWMLNTRLCKVGDPLAPNQSNLDILTQIQKGFLSKHDQESEKC